MRQIKNKKVPSTKVDGTFSTASQSFAAMRRKELKSIFGGGVYVAENTSGSR